MYISGLPDEKEDGKLLGCTGGLNVVLAPGHVILAKKRYTTDYVPVKP